MKLADGSRSTSLLKVEPVNHPSERRGTRQRMKGDRGTNWRRSDGAGLAGGTSLARTAPDATARGPA